jgi:prophage DNA circulation protein
VTALTPDSLLGISATPRDSRTGARPFLALQKASFLGIAFRCESIKVRGGVRDFVHEYPHSPGGQPETLGRKLYVAELEAVFVVDDQFYPTAWPGDIGQLRSQFEEEARGTLVIPTVGSFRAYCKDWDLTNTNKMMNGERMRMVFMEDQEVSQLTDEFFFQHDVIATNYGKFAAAITSATLKLDAFEQIAELVSEIESFKDRADLAQRIIANKMQQLADACRYADEAVRDLDKPQAWAAVRALHDLGVSADKLARDAFFTGLPITIYECPVEMTVADISTAIYGDTSKMSELLDLNPFENPFAVPAGFDVKHYQAPLLGIAV